MLFLVDSTAWIEYLRPNRSKKVKDRVRKIIRREEACTCGIVVVEVLRSAKTEKDWNTLWESLNALPQLPLDDAVIERAPNGDSCSTEKARRHLRPTC